MEINIRDVLAKHPLEIASCDLNINRQVVFSFIMLLVLHEQLQTNSIIEKFICTSLKNNSHRKFDLFSLGSLFILGYFADSEERKYCGI